MKLYRIVTSYFVAGIIIENNKIIKAAPIVKYMIGRNISYVINYCSYKKWDIRLIKM